MNAHVLFGAIFISSLLCLAADQPAKPKLKVADDGFPAGRDTPEGVACDLARAFIKRDAKLLTSTCLNADVYKKKKGSGDYRAFLEEKIDSIHNEAKKAEPSAGGPKAIGKVFAARHLSKQGPASYGYAVFGFKDVMFVDVGVFLQNGNPSLNRTLVVKDGDGKWYVHPMPSVSPLLSDGLDDEKASQTDFSDAYQIEK